MKLSIVLIALFVNAAFACDSEEYEFKKILNGEGYTVKGPFSIETLEKTNIVEIREMNKKVPFGYQNEKWEKLKSQYQEGDEVYFVRFDSKSRFFFEQHVLVRQGCIIGVLPGRIS